MESGNSTQQTALQKQYYNMDENNLPAFNAHTQFFARRVKNLAAGAVGLIQISENHIIAKIFPDGVCLWQHSEWTTKMKIDYVPFAEILGWDD